MTQKDAATLLRLKATRIPILILLPLCFTGLTCSDNGVVPIDNTPPGRRDYVWTIDTLRSPMNALQSIWGSSPSDVWVVGAGGETATRLFHFDGITWSNWPMPCTGNTIFGFSANDVWLGGGDGQIWRFDGNGWSKHFTYSPNKAQIVFVDAIWGTARNNVYAVGVIWEDTTNTSQRGFVLRFDGTNWKEVYRATFYSQFFRVLSENGLVYISDIKLGYTHPDTITFHMLAGTTLQTIYSDAVPANLTNLSSKVYFVISRDILRYVRGEFVKLVSISDIEYDYQVCGRSEKDIFVLLRGALAHYNGSDIQRLATFANKSTTVMGSLVTFEQVGFFLVRDWSTGTNMVLRGSLGE